MGQKVNPHGLRVGVIKDWDSRWYARNEKVGDLLVEDYKLRKYLKKTLYSAGIPKIEIERDNAKVRIYLHCARPGVVIGKGGDRDRAVLRLQLEKMLGKPVALNIVEVKQPRHRRPAGGREHRPAAGEAHLLPPRHEEQPWAAPCALGAQRHQGHVLRPSGRR